MRRKGPADKEVDDLLRFISAKLKELTPTHGDSKKLARECGVTEPTITHYKSYGEPSVEKGKRKGERVGLRTAYKILRGILQRPPINLGLSEVSTGPLEEKTVPGSADADKCFGVPLLKEGIEPDPTKELNPENIEGFIGVYKPELKTRWHLVAFKLGPKARSMEPLLRPGDIVVIDLEDKEIDKKSVYAVGFDERSGAYSLRRVQLIDNKWILISENPDYPPVVLDYEQHQDLIYGKVIWSWASWIKRKSSR